MVIPKPEVLKTRLRTVIFFLYFHHVKIFPLSILLGIMQLPTQAQTPVVDSLLTIVAKHTRDSTEIFALDEVIEIYLRKDLNKARGYTFQLLALAQAIDSPSGLALSYTTFIHLYQATGRLDSAQYYLDRFGELYKKRPGHWRVAANYTNTAGLFYKAQGKYKEALPYLVEALRIIEPSGNKTSIAGQMLNIGNAYNNLGDLKTAASYHLRSLALFEEIGNKRGQSFCLNSLGNDFLPLKQLVTAEKYLLRAEQLKTELDDKRGLQSTWMTLGEVYQHMDNPKASMAYYTRALTRAKELELRTEESRVLFNMASMLKGDKQYTEARKRFTQALPLVRQAGDSLTASRIQSELIILNNRLQREKQEEQTLLGNITVSLEKGNRTQTAEGHFHLAEWYSSRRQFEEAFTHLKQAQALEDSVNGHQVLLQLKRLEEEYKNDKKEREIALLKKDQEVQALALDKQKVINLSIVIVLIFSVAIGVLLINRYRAMNAAKRTLEIERVRNHIARDLHDEMGSALSSINILSQVALVENDGNTHSYLQRIGDQSTRIMESMSDMVWSINPGNDPIGRMVMKMREFTAEILDAKNITYRFSDDVAEDLRVDADKRKNLFLIFKESLNNAAKYSQASEIVIDLRQQDHTVTLQVSDNGRGFDEARIKAGNGLRNLRERARDIHSTLTITSAPGAGTRIYLQMPLA